MLGKVLAEMTTRKVGFLGAMDICLDFKRFFSFLFFSFFLISAPMKNVVAIVLVLLAVCFVFRVEDCLGISVRNYRKSEISVYSLGIRDGAVYACFNPFKRMR